MLCVVFLEFFKNGCCGDCVCYGFVVWLFWW